MGATVELAECIAGSSDPVTPRARGAARHALLDWAGAALGGAHVTVGLQPTLLTVCDITAPETGLEVKFSVRHLVAMALLGRDTTEPGAFTDQLAAEVADLCQRVSAVPLATDKRMETEVRIELRSGGTLDLRCDVSAPADDLDAQGRALTDKFLRLARPVLAKRAEDAAEALLTAPYLADIHESLRPET
ncbi:MAG: hypothetical protein AAF367_20585 [Pseudomonadota bacterium]